MKYHLHVVLLLPALLFLSCKTAEFGFKVIDVNGMIYDFSNRPVPACSIALGSKYKSTTDINGRFTLSKIPVGNYTITGQKKGFEPYVDELSIKDKGQIIYIRIPSQIQLLDLADQALTKNDLEAAREMAERAYQIDNNNIETLFYCATVQFRLNAFDTAAAFLEAAKNLGSKDIYIDQFLSLLKESQNEKQSD
jgi:thioredoxin-like negative regulator of GroEL